MLLRGKKPCKFDAHCKIYKVFSMKRIYYLNQIEHLLTTHPAVALLGPRQCGKTTLAKQVAEHFPLVHFFDLENPRDLARLEDPLLALESLEGLIVIDEVQRLPDLFPVLRFLIDQFQTKQRYLILGSASRDLIKQSSETLAGRIAYMELTPFILSEVKESEKLWLRGGFPLSFLADDEHFSLEWREFYITTFLERDIPALGFKIASQLLRRFWMMLAHYHGQIFNASAIGQSLGVSGAAVRRYLDILTGTFMIRELTPWWENISKRQVKSPKIYFRDSGLLHTLLGIETFADLQNHPKLGASWEGYALEQVIQYYHAKSETAYFWATQSGAELDLMIIQKGKRLGFEFKYASAPRLTVSMKNAFQELKLDELTVVCPGHETYLLAPRVQVVGLQKFGEE